MKFTDNPNFFFFFFFLCAKYWIKSNGKEWNSLPLLKESRMKTRIFPFSKLVWNKACWDKLLHIKAYKGGFQNDVSRERTMGRSRGSTGRGASRKAATSGNELKSGFDKK